MLETFFYIVCPKTTNAINNIASEYRPTIRNALKRLIGRTPLFKRSSTNYSCGGKTRTCDLQVMSLASYQLLHSAILPLSQFLRYQRLLYF